jgi:hypothetical protein
MILDARRAVHDMVVCQHQTVRCKDDAGSRAFVATMDVDDSGADGFDGADSLPCE